MGRVLVLVVAGLVGLLCAAGVGVAAYLVSRDSVAVPVTRLQPKPRLTPDRVQAKPARTARRRTRTATTTTTGATSTTGPTTTVDDHGGRGRDGGGDHSGPGGGRGGDD